VLLQVLEQLFRVSMLWEQFQRLLHVLVALLELALLVEQVSDVVGGLEQERAGLRRLLEVRPRLVYVTLSQLKHTQIVECFCVVRVVAHTDLERLISEAQVTDADSDVAHIIPYF
jgi:hypothetical protein